MIQPLHDTFYLGVVLASIKEESKGPTIDKDSVEGLNHESKV